MVGRHVCAGQRPTGTWPPEPCAQVRILLGAPDPDLEKCRSACGHVIAAAALAPPLSVTRGLYPPLSAPHTLPKTRCAADRVGSLRCVTPTRCARTVASATLVP